MSFPLLDVFFTIFKRLCQGVITSPGRSLTRPSHDNPEPAQTDIPCPAAQPAAAVPVLSLLDTPVFAAVPELRTLAGCKPPERQDTAGGTQRMLAASGMRFGPAVLRYSMEGMAQVRVPEALPGAAAANTGYCLPR